MLNILIRLAALMGSYFGWWEYFRRRWKVGVYFLPAFTLAVHFTLLFLPGLFNFLEEMSLLLYFGGMVLALDALRREKLSLFQPYLNVGYGFAIVLFGIVALSVRGRVFTWFDNFTHWATVVKNMLQFDRFPTFAQTAVGFPSYPLGSSTLVYYFCNVTSDEESMQMLAQGFLDVCMLLPVFSYVKKQPVACGILALVLGNFLLGYNTPVQELLVDTLLPLTAMASIAFAHQQYLHREEGQNIWLVFPMLFLTLNIKNAAFFFLAVAVVLLLFWQRKAGLPLKNVLWVLLALGIGYFLWDRHCDYVFVNADMTQHAISAAYMKGRLSEKTPQVMLTIVRNVFRFAFTRKEFLWMLGSGVLLGGLAWFTAPSLRKPFARIAAFFIPVYLLYIVSLAGMYVFSMSASGALGLESIDRYMRTIDIAYLYWLLIGSFCLLNSLSNGRFSAVVSLLLIAGAVGLWQGYTPSKLDAPDGDAIRREISSILDEYGVAPGHCYLILGSGEKELYRHYVYRYCLNSPDVTSLVVTEAAQLDAQKEYQYIIIEDTDNPVVQAWVQEHYPDQVGQLVIQDF